MSARMRATMLVATLAVAGSPSVVWAQATIAPPVVEFGDQPAGTRSAPRLVELVNLGQSPFYVHLAELNSGPDNADFVGTKDGCTGITLGPGARCGVEIAFEPKGPGPTSQTFGFDVSGDDYRTLAERAAVVTLNGTGTGTVADARTPRDRAASSTVPEGLFLPVIGIAAIGLGLIAMASTRRAAGGR